VQDPQDKCPNKKGPAANGGCPDVDTDGDGVVDRLDNCPKVKGDPKHHGCVKKQLVVINTNRIQLLEKVFFRTNRARIRRRSFALLNNIATVLVSHSNILKIEVAGHTDDVGPAEYNRKLSQRRAEAVVAYLIKRGVAADRLVAVGYGEDMPTMPGRSRKARNANRRVEFKVIKSAPNKGVIK